jgi:hypothetical protein
VVRYVQINMLSAIPFASGFAGCGYGQHELLTVGSQTESFAKDLRGTHQDRN